VEVTALHVAKEIAKNNKCYKIRKYKSGDWGNKDGITMEYLPYQDKYDIDPYETKSYFIKKYKQKQMDGTLSIWDVKELEYHKKVKVIVSIWPVDKEEEIKLNKKMNIFQKSIPDFYMLVQCTALGKPNTAYRRWMELEVKKAGRKFKVKIEKSF